MNAPLGTALNTDGSTDALSGLLTRDGCSSSVSHDALSGDCMWQFWCFFVGMFMSMFML